MDGSEYEFDNGILIISGKSISNRDLTDIISIIGSDEIMHLVCSDCLNLRYIPQLPNLTILDCSYCPVLRHIALMPELTELNCSECPKLKTIPTMPELIILNCKQCNKLKTISVMSKLTKLFCTGCLELKTIPTMPELTQLWCYKCPILHEISPMPKLISLDCYDCPILETIPTMPKLSRLICTRCRMLNEIFPMPELTLLSCAWCPLLELNLVNFPQLTEIRCTESGLAGRLVVPANINCNCCVYPPIYKTTNFTSCENNVTGGICAICRESFKDIPEENKCYTVQGHEMHLTVHRGCLEEWLSTRVSDTNKHHTECPVCRGEIVPIHQTDIAPIKPQIDPNNDFGRRRRRSRKSRKSRRRKSRRKSRRRKSRRRKS